MEYFLLIVLLAIVTLFTLAPFLCYQKTGKQFVEFYTWMATFSKARRLYRFSFSMLVTLFNYIVVVLTGPSLWLIPGVILSVLLLSGKFTSAIFRWLHDDRRIQGLAFSVFLFTLAFPLLFTLSITIGMIIIAAMFYPFWGLTLYFQYTEEFEKNETIKKAAQHKVYFTSTMYFISLRSKYELAHLDP